MKKLLFALVLVTIGMSSCSKDAATTLVGKWKLVSIVMKSSVYNNTISGTSADYVDFKTNKTVETYFQGDLSTTSYSINGNSLEIDGQNFTINTLTSSIAVLYSSEGTGSSKTETTINLKK